MDETVLNEARTFAYGLALVAFVLWQFDCAERALRCGATKRRWMILVGAAFVWGIGFLIVLPWAAGEDWDTFLWSRHE